MRKDFNKLATLALSGMMVMSMAMPAFAEKITVEGALTKTLHTDGKTYAPNTEFTFKVKPEPAGKFKATTGQVYTTLVAEEGAIEVTPAKFAPAADDETDIVKKLGVTDANGASFTSKANFIFNTDKFNQGEGIYKFSLNEDAGDYDGIRYNGSQFYVYISYYLKEEGGVKKPDFKVLLAKKTGERDEHGLPCEEKPDDIPNNYGKHVPPVFPDPDPNPNPGPGPKPKPTPNDSTHDVTITKKIMGAGANPGEKFKFTVTVIPSNAGEKYHIENVGSTITFDHLKANQASAAFEVTDNTGIKIYGLTQGDQVIVNELESGKGYTMTVDVPAAQKDSNNPTFVKELGLNNSNPYEAHFNVIKDDAKVFVQNTPGRITPTGIVMNVAPYAMMLAVAGGLGVVFVNRKKEEE